MGPRGWREDDLSRHRSGQPPAGGPVGVPKERDGGNDAEIRADWKDILAMIIAAYQVILPVLAAFVGVIAIVYLLFRFFFVR